MLRFPVAVLATFVIAACGFDSSIAVRAVPDAGGSQPCSEWQERLFFEPCALENPGDSVLDLSMPGVYVFDSTARVLVDPATNAISVATAVITDTEPELAVLNVGGLVVGELAELRVRGGRPVVLMSWSTITIEGEVNARSSTGAGFGAGAGTGACPELGVPQVSNGRGGGGGGAGFGSIGGNGGNGSDGAAMGASGGQATSISALRGGCSGGDGADVGEGEVGDGGAGGGAVMLIASQSVTVNGIVHAGGQGGRGAIRANGGGGGGSGGVIALVSPTVELSDQAVLASNGGGGSEGGDATEEDRGGFGQPGLASDQVAGGGGGLGSGAGNGGAGATGTSPPANGDSRFYSGGGGGGGVGFVIVQAGDFEPGAAIITPPASQL